MRNYGSKNVAKLYIAGKTRERFVISIIYTLICTITRDLYTEAWILYSVLRVSVFLCATVQHLDALVLIYNNKI